MSRTLIQIFVLLYTCSCIISPLNAENAECIRSSGTGTVLFDPTAIYKTCWSQEEIAILTARVILEDIIPDPKLISIKCNEDVEVLVEYFQLVINKIRDNTKPRKRHILLMALTDLLGGYLHHAILPMARKAFYHGALDYVYMEKLIQLYEELKWFLRTNGQGWTKPITVTRKVRVPPIEIPLEPQVSANDSASSCNKVMFFEHEPLRLRKRSVTVEKGIYFPLPFFDAKNRPTAIALPLRHYSLRNIESKRAAYAVTKYFVSAELCLKEKSAKPEMIQKFRNNLYTWIEKDVVPKLDDDKFYSAFGGILRVEDTLRLLGAKLGSKSCNSDEMEEDMGAIPGAGCSKRNKLLLIAVLVVIVAWFIMGTCFICHRMKNKKAQEGDGPKKPPSASSSFTSSKWSSMLSRQSSSSRKGSGSVRSCKCIDSTSTEKSTVEFSSTSDSERPRESEKRFAKLSKLGQTKSAPCPCPSGNGPAIIDTNHSMKMLPSIAEMSENSLQKEQKITFGDEVQVCAPPWAQSKHTVLCPKYPIKSNEMSSSTSGLMKNQEVQESLPPEQSTRAEETSEGHVTGSSTPEQTPSHKSTDFHTSKTESESQYLTYQTSGACHSSISGAYDLFHRPDPNKPYIFGYDFQTSTSSELSEDDDEVLSKYDNP